MQMDQEQQETCYITVMAVMPKENILSGKEPIFKIGL